MTRWQSITIAALLAGAVAGAQHIRSAPLRDMADAMLLVLTAANVHGASVSNPDGTDARLPWEPKK